MADEEEETILLVELNGVPNPSVIKQPNTPCYILGIGTDNPVIQVGRYIFKGHYRDIIGSALMFEKNSTNRDINYEFVGKSFKRLSATRVILNKKTAQEDEQIETKKTVPHQEEPREETPMETNEKLTEEQ